MKRNVGTTLTACGATLALTSLVLSTPLGVLLGAALLLAGLVVRFNRVAPAIVVALLIGGCSLAAAGKPDWFGSSEKTSNQIAAAAFQAVPYPIAEVKAGGFLERRNQVEKLKRFSDGNKLGYVYVMSFGKFIGYYATKGKVSAVNSQLTNSQQTWDCGSDCSQAVESIGDDGTWGTNEGGDRGVFFFTTGGVMVVTTLDWMYVDQPLDIGNVPQLYK